MTDPNGGGYYWSDCIYAKPLPPGTAIVSWFIISSGRAVGKYALDCSAVRKIKDTRGYSGNTDDCINIILTKAMSHGTSKSNNTTNLTTRPWADRLVYFKGFVVTSKSGNHRIVTAYTDSNIPGVDGSGEWTDCKKYLG
ncbi:hypothetical protein [Nocardioides panacihumi]|uniref:hypothetical protein n=1 Tax=Nocardioides panacihumi TaxID=400774 RepID=UPI0031DDA735